VPICPDLPGGLSINPQIEMAGETGLEPAALGFGARKWRFCVVR